MDASSLYKLFTDPLRQTELLRDPLSNVLKQASLLLVAMPFAPSSVLYPPHVLKQASCLRHLMLGTSTPEGTRSSCPLPRQCQRTCTRPQTIDTVCDTGGSWNGGPARGHMDQMDYQTWSIDVRVECSIWSSALTPSCVPSQAMMSENSLVQLQSICLRPDQRCKNRCAPLQCDRSVVTYDSHVSREDQLQLLTTGEEELEQAPNS